MTSFPTSSQEDEQLQQWFKETFSNRFWSAVGRGLVLHGFLLLFLSFIFSSDFKSISVTQLLSPVLYPSAWVYDLMWLAALTGAAVSTARSFRVAAVTSSRPSPKEVAATLVGYVLAGGILVRVYLGLILSAWATSYNSFTVPCSTLSGSELKCLNENHFFVVCSGAFVGLFIWREFIFGEGQASVVDFADIPLSSWSRLRLRLPQLAKESANIALSSLKWFCVVYVLFGHSFFQWLSLRLLGRRKHQHDDDEFEKSLISPYLNWLCALLISSFLNWMAAFALRACASEVVLLALGEAVQDWPNSSLAWRALTIRKSKGTEGNNKDKLVQYWAFADLTRLEKARRVEIYSLSDPGGHPHQWNLVCDACLSLVDSFTQELNAAVFPKNGSSKVATPTVREWRPGQEGQQLRLRKLPEKESLPPNEKKGGTKTEGIYGILRTLLQRISLERISSRVFSSSSSAKEVFAKRKVVMWAVTGLSQLISCAVLEDQFGVVQEKLAKVINSMLVLQQAIDRHRAPLGPTSSSRCRQELRLCVKTALYRIVVAYGPHLEPVLKDPQGIDSDLRHKLQDYVNFMES